MTFLSDPIFFADNVLDFGSGERRYYGRHILAVDKRQDTPGVICHDLNTFPYPFKPAVFDYIIAQNILEHLESLPLVFMELARITRPKGIIRGCVPHYSSNCSYADREHCHLFSIHTLHSYCEGRPATFIETLLNCDVRMGGFRSEFRVNKVFLTFRRFSWITGIPIIGKLFPSFWEAYLAGICPARDIYFELIRL